MGSVRFALRAELRRGLPGMLWLALLLGLIGGVVLTAAAGARRTDTAYPRLLRWANAAQVDIIPNGNGPFHGYFAALPRLPQVASMSSASLYNVVLPVRHGLPQTQVETLSSPDGTFGVTADRVKILKGQLFNPRAAGQAMIDQRLADLEHVRPGGTLHLLVVPNNPSTGNPELQHAMPMAFQVSAIATFDTQIVPANSTNSEPMALLSQPFSVTPLAASSSYGTQAGVRLRPGGNMATFLHSAARLAQRYPATGRRLDIVSLADQVTATERAIRPEAIALGVFAALAGLIALAIIGQLLSRQIILDATEFPILRVLGMTRGRLVVLSLARVGQTVQVVVNQVQAVPGQTSPTRTMRIVGVAVFPSFGRGSFSATNLGTGAAVSPSVLSAPFSQLAGCARRFICYNFFLVRYKPGTNVHAAAARLTAAESAAHIPPGCCTVTADQRPSDIKNYTGVRDTPLVLGAVLVLLAIGTLSHVLLTGVRRRRRDLAVLKPLGLVRLQMLRVSSGKRAPWQRWP
jgi:hypothetical protein